MRIGQYAEDSSVKPWAGVTSTDGTVVKLPEVAEEAGIRLPRRVSDVLGEWRWQEKVSLLVDRAEAQDLALYDRGRLDVAAPVSDPQKVICVGLNYEDHAAEAGEDPPEQPVLFSKFPTAITGPEGTVEWDPDLTDEVDYEVELVVVIGREAREVPVAEARNYVAGYTVGNDVSARDIQMGDGQWVRGKSLDTFAPLGPELVTPEEVEDPHELDL
jgi:2-keto-4-pentenoate hydratase/2-oxohepta-3-ene-1,7-dioic acid hydratase in catechol pathway